MSPQYMSVDVPHLYFAGAAAHARDYRKAAGGFIHGLRYTARALSRVLAERYHDEPWPHATVGRDGGYKIGRQLVFGKRDV